MMMTKRTVTRVLLCVKDKGEFQRERIPRSEKVFLIIHHLSH